MARKDTDADFRHYADWRKHILDPENCKGLPPGFTRVTLIAYCLAMADQGHNGKDCFAGDATIGRMIGISNRNVVARYRHLAKRLEWFAPNGVKRNRVEHLDVNIPWVPVDVSCTTENSNPEDSGCTTPLRNEPEDDPWAVSDDEPLDMPGESIVGCTTPRGNAEVSGHCTTR